MNIYNLEPCLKIGDAQPDAHTPVPQVGGDLLKAVSSTQHMIWGDQDSSTEALPLLGVTHILQGNMVESRGQGDWNEQI